MSIGISPDIIVLRTEHPIDEAARAKIALFCNVPDDCVIENIDLPSLYEIPLALEEAGLANTVIRLLSLECGEPDLSEWRSMVDRSRNLKDSVTIALVGKYIELHDSYLSVMESLKHAGIHCGCKVKIDWIDSETLNDDNAAEILGSADGILVPGGFGSRGIEGKIAAAKYARENKVPYLGICLGMQIAIIEFARDVLGLKDANSTEFDPDTPDPVIDIMPDQRGVRMGGTMRLGQYPCVLDPESKIYRRYGRQNITERHRHRFEVNNDYRERFEAAGLRLCGVSPDKHIVEMIEIPDHPWFAATQAHPEFKSRPNRAHPRFIGLVETSMNEKKKK